MSAVERIDSRDVEGLRVGRLTGQLNTTCILYRLGRRLLDTGPPRDLDFDSSFSERIEYRWPFSAKWVRVPALGCRAPRRAAGGSQRRRRESETDPAAPDAPSRS